MISTPIPIDIPLRHDADGVIRIGKSRVTLQSVVSDFERGASPEEIVHHYPALNLADVYFVIGYILQNRAEVDAYVTEQRRLAAQVRQEVESHYPNDPLRAKLLAALEARQKQAGS
ncbi:MAG: hypothetical protein BroJett018_52640 [Chloroflexota bacterium]|nr:MAG: hypothetical protein BroJett018_52640 [Chloroflexota bacterium]